jgi:hypothetical protein
VKRWNRARLHLFAPHPTATLPIPLHSLSPPTFTVLSLTAHRNVQSAIDYAKSTISDLLQNKMDISMLVITKQLGACCVSGTLWVDIVVVVCALPAR